MLRGGGTGITTGTASITANHQTMEMRSEGSCSWWKCGKIVYVYGEFFAYSVYDGVATFTCTGFPAPVFTATLIDPCSMTGIRVELVAGSTSIVIIKDSDSAIRGKPYFSYLTSE